MNRIMLKDISQDNLDVLTDTLWVFMQESAKKVDKNDAVLKHEITQAYDFLNGIGYTTARPPWEDREVRGINQKT